MWLAIYATLLLMLVDITLAEIFLTSLGMGTLLTVCQDQLISWNGNTGDVQVTVRGGEKIIETLPTISKDQQNVTWRVDVPALNIYNFRVTDLSTQEWAGSPQIPCRANSHADSTCVGQNPGWVGYGDGSDASSTSATSSASATFSSPSATAPASSIITSPSSTPSSPLTDSLPPDPTHKSNTVAIAVGVSIPALVLLLGSTWHFNLATPPSSPAPTRIIRRRHTAMGCTTLIARAVAQCCDRHRLQNTCLVRRAALVNEHQ
ncbi:hypothetical protein BKA62DRAFT_51444 [Auriculariales sp. MPI-PUGE-AT-0066]|nr:hypothetical protein BKA62DRAFT_51444 [Auriculariales sp. MPI-PUGE-AT-0066]